jgi:hypothetical protein
MIRDSATVGAQEWPSVVPHARLPSYLTLASKITSLWRVET